MNAHVAQLAPEPRESLRFDLTSLVGTRWWFADNPVLTHMGNALHLMFPTGEAFMIRCLRNFVAHIDDPQLVKDVQTFVQQEAGHAREHRKFEKVMVAQGYDPGPFVRLYKRLTTDLLEKHSPALLQLATVAGLEHFTATLSHAALTTQVMDDLPEPMRSLLRWHCAEEIEHKAVAYDVLAHVDDSYSLRVAGMAMATLHLTFFWLAGTWMMMHQERLSVRAILRYRKAAARERRSRNCPGRRTVLARAIVDYLRPSFHPNELDDYHLARDFFASRG